MHWSEIFSAAATLFLVMDSLGNVPVFHVILSRVDPGKRSAIVARELVIALAIMFVFLLAGNSMFSFLGLTESSLSIAGGVLLFIISLHMIFPGRRNLSDSFGTDDPFIVPMAVPLIAGPSAIAVLLLLSSDRPDELAQWSLALILAWIPTTAILIFSTKVMALIGMRGARALERLMGMILVIIAVQMLLNGIRDFVQSL